MSASAQAGRTATSSVAIVPVGGTGPVQHVGTSRVITRGPTTAGELLAGLRSVDGSTQVRSIRSVDGLRKTPSCAVEAGDEVLVVASDKVGRARYRIEIGDPVVGCDEDFWDEPRYRAIDAAVNAALPAFPALVLDITAPEFAPHVTRVAERFAVGNEAGDPGRTDSPLVFREREVWYYGGALDAAIRACHAAGGGTVVVPAEGSDSGDGVYVTGAVRLLSGVRLHVEEGATLRFIRNRAHRYYPLVRTSYQGNDLYSFSPLIYAYGQQNIALTGRGVLDGGEDMWNWRPWKKGYWGEPCVESPDDTGGYGTNAMLETMNAQALPVEERLFTADGALPETIEIPGSQSHQQPPPPGAQAHISTFRPSFVQPYGCRNVVISDVRLRNVPFWVVHPVECTNVLIRGVEIESDKTADFEAEGWNNDDGLDPESCTNVVIEQCHVVVSDDGVAIKAGRGRDGRERRTPTTGVIVRDSRFGNRGGHSAAVSIGSEMSAGVRNVFVHDCTFGGPGQALAVKLKTNSDRGGAIEDVYLRDCLLEDAELAMIQFEGDYGDLPRAPGRDLFDPVIRHVRIDNLRSGPGMPDGRTMFWIPSSAARSPIRDVRCRNSLFHTSRALEAGLGEASFLQNFLVEDLVLVDPATGVSTRVATHVLPALERVTARYRDGTTIDLPETEGQGAPTVLPEGPFKLEVVLGPSDHPRFAREGLMEVHVDREARPARAALDGEGAFVTEELELDDGHEWYRDRHYLSVTLRCGADVATAVHHVRIDHPSTGGGSS